MGHYLQYTVVTRTSQLARKQADLFCDRYAEIDTSDICRIVGVLTKGDKASGLLRHMKKAFVGELESYLLDHRADIAIHSLKDLSVLPSANLIISAMLPRCDARDVFVSDRFQSLDALPSGSIVGTSSVRRCAQIKAKYPGLRVRVCRGNVNTRIEKLRGGHFDGLLLAAAGLLRLGIATDLHVDYLSTEWFTPACGQGIIAAQIRSQDVMLGANLSHISHEETFQVAQLEREIVRCFGGDCSTPLGVFVSKGRGSFEVRVFLGDALGHNPIYHSENWPVQLDSYQSLIDCLVESILQQGGDTILDQCHKDLSGGFDD